MAQMIPDPEGDAALTSRFRPPAFKDLQAAWAVAEGAPVPILFVDRWGGAGLANAAARALLACGATGDPVADGFLPEDCARLRAALHPGSSPQRLLCRTGGATGRMLQVEIAPFAAAGLDLGWLLLLSDVTDLVAPLQAERDRLALELAEARHRTRNLYATVSGLAELGRGDEADGAAAREALLGRVRALAAAHTALDAPEGLTAAGLVRMVLQPLAVAERVAVTEAGPMPRLDRARAGALALALNELATNALKHGGLSRPGGRIDVEVEFRPRADDPGAGELRLAWVERGGPPPVPDGGVSPPVPNGGVPPAVPYGGGPPLAPDSGGGFGTKLIAMTVERQLGGRVCRRWDGDALRIALAVPFARVSA